ncbi:hypothetical protein IQ241_24785 [Romeria aff. gracilis LEGE 07310]|uniref:Uncharacterized protein n=1 Tax=Vasconcelosia minhoensis LEGE 07310 TaxID=915328 RepID=A0A8J7AYW8_9CYAN|nr:hypothetical protein [Romeria aff. gracilis LEGE 07310]
MLDSIETTLQWASRMLWKGIEPVVHYVTDRYEKGIKVDPETLATFRVNWHPSEDLPKWAITISPT